MSDAKLDAILNMLGGVNAQLKEFDARLKKVESPKAKGKAKPSSPDTPEAAVAPTISRPSPTAVAVANSRAAFGVHVYLSLMERYAVNPRGRQIAKFVFGDYTLNARLVRDPTSGELMIEGYVKKSAEGGRPLPVRAATHPYERFVAKALAEGQASGMPAVVNRENAALVAVMEKDTPVFGILADILVPSDFDAKIRGIVDNADLKKKMDSRVLREISAEDDDLTDS